jgi:hypothetical protein
LSSGGAVGIREVSNELGDHSTVDWQFTTVLDQI